MAALSKPRARKAFRSRNRPSSTPWRLWGRPAPGCFTALINHSQASAAQSHLGNAAFTMAAGTAISTTPTGVEAGASGGAVSITTGTLAADSSGATSLATNIGDFTLGQLSTTGQG